MAEILRPNFDKLWASAGSVIEPSELKIEMGWMEEIPPSQWENWIQLRQDQAIKYIFQRGIPAWDAKEEYFAGRSAVLLDGDIYIALRNNVNKSPKTNAADWRVVTKDLTIANISGLQAALNNKADKTVSITGVGGLTGGGTLAENRTIDLSAATKNSLTLADGALQKTQNLNDLPNKATARNNLGLGTAATRNVTTSNADVTADRLLKVGDLGTNQHPAAVVDFNALPDLYPYSGAVPVMSDVGSSNVPPNGGHLYYHVVQYFYVGGNVTQIAIPYRVDYDGLWMRSRFWGTWSPWREIYHSGNLPTIDWGSLTGKPPTFPPSAHTHPWSQITGAPATATRWPTWEEVSGKPTNFNTTWSLVSGKPTTFTPSSHTHHWSQIQGVPYIPNVLGATGNSTVDTISQKVISEQLNNRVQGDTASAVGFLAGDVNQPYLRHAPTQDIVSLARTPSQRINLGASGVNNLGRPMIVTFMSSIASQYKMEVLVDGYMVGRTISPHNNTLGGSVTVVVLAGQSWSADFVDRITGWLL